MKIPKLQIVRSRRSLAALGGYLPEETNYLFDQGSYDTFSEVSTDNYRITPVLHRNSLWNYWGLRSGKFAGKTPTFLVDHTAKAFTFANERLACWATAADTDTWTDFTTQSRGATDNTIQHDGSAFPGGVVYIASQPLYPFSRTQRLVGEWASNALVGETASTTSKIFGYTTARDANDGSGRTSPVLPYYGLLVSSGAGTKNKAILTARSHPNETPGGFALEGAMAWLLAGSVEANFLLDYWNLWVYPCINPQGVYSGFWSANPQLLQQHNDTTAGFEDMDAHTTAMSADTGGTIDAGFDYHGYNGNITARGIVYNASAAANVAFRDAYLALEAGFALEADTTAAILTRWWETTLSAGLTVNVENGMNLSRTITHYKASGEYSLRALAAMTAQGRFTNGPSVGSRDFDGATNRIDWANVFNTAGSAITISAWINVDAYIANPNTAYILASHRSGDAAYGTVFAVTWSGRLVFFRNGTTGLARYSAAANPTGNDAWVHVLVTHDGVMTTYSSVNLYIGGVDRSDNTDAVNGAGEYAATGSWSLGGRIYDDNRCLNGMIAQVGVWNRVLGAGDIANLAAGHAPSTIATGLQFYFAGNTSSLTASPGGDGTADGTSQLTGVGNGPTIYY